MCRSRSRDDVVHVYDAASNVTERTNTKRFHRAHTVTGWEVNLIGNRTAAPKACGLPAIPPL